MRVKIKDLYPTQISVGYEQVKEKCSSMHKLSESDLKLFLKGHSVPIILGLDKRMYIIDHHHLCFAAYDNNIDELYGNIVKDYSSLTKDEFWNTMISEKYVWLYNEHGNIMALDNFLEELPISINKLKNDPYRSLAGIIRNEGGYDKIWTPFVEFSWANFYRTRIEIPDNCTKFEESLLNKALKLSSSLDAKNLPGYNNN